MSYYEYLFCALDVLIFVMIFRLIKVSRTIELELKVSAKWVITAFFLIMCVIVFFRYSGFFKYMEMVLILIMAGLYHFVKYGLNQEGIINAGRLIPYEDAGDITVDDEKGILSFRRGHDLTSVYFDPAQAEEVKHYLKKIKWI
ncbi:MAG: hypothetical protein IJJ44_10075 [Solobacterium sp.]|nr:hypothetical protein [Solobacterium sp.]